MTFICLFTKRVLIIYCQSGLTQLLHRELFNSEIALFRVPNIMIGKTFLGDCYKRYNHEEDQDREA